MKIALHLFLLLLFCFQSLAQGKVGNINSTGQVKFTDSLSFSNPTDSLNQKVRSVHSTVNNLKDSLDSKITFPDPRLIINAIDSINKQIKASQRATDATVDNLSQKLQSQVPNSLRSSLPKHAELLPDIEVPTMKIAPVQQVGRIKRVQEVSEFSEVSDINKLKEVKNISQLDEVTSISDQVNEVKDKVPDTGNISEKVENEFKNLQGIKALEDQKAEMGDFPKGINQLQDNEYFKEEWGNKAKEKAVDHFEGQKEKLQAAQTKLANIKNKFPEGVASINNLPKKKPNPMKGKPFKERLILGLTVQIHPDKVPNIDLSPFAAYKLSEKLSLGGGGSYRLMTKDHFKGFTNEGAVYGFRALSNFMLPKGIFIHAEYEMLKTLVRDSISFGRKENILERKWIDGLLLGVGKEYKIAGLVKGNMQVLYNFLYEPNSPYQERVIVRFGFSFQLKDKLKKPDVKSELEKAIPRGKIKWKK